MREQNIEVIRKACIAANPEIEQGYWIGGNDELYDPQPSWINEPMIRLADVLLAIGTTHDSGYEVDAIGRFSNRGEPLDAEWNLRKDLTDQTDECLVFLANLLK